MGRRGRPVIPVLQYAPRGIARIKIHFWIGGDQPRNSKYSIHIYALYKIVMHTATFAAPGRIAGKDLLGGMIVCRII